MAEWQGASRGDEQALWRMAHEVGARLELDEGKLADLRGFAADRARNQHFAVFDGFAVRASFADALEHAARDLLAGRKPE